VADDHSAHAKGWTGPKEVDGHKVEGFWRAHQIPILDPQTNPAHLAEVEAWLRSYRPEELFDESGKLIEELREMAPRVRGALPPILTQMAACCASRCKCLISATMPSR